MQSPRSRKHNSLPTTSLRSAAWSASPDLLASSSINQEKSRPRKMTANCLGFYPLIRNRLCLQGQNQEPPRDVSPVHCPRSRLHQSLPPPLPPPDQPSHRGLAGLCTSSFPKSSYANSLMRSRSRKPATSRHPRSQPPKSSPLTNPLRPPLSKLIQTLHQH